MDEVGPKPRGEIGKRLDKIMIWDSRGTGAGQGWDRDGTDLGQFRDQIASE